MPKADALETLRNAGGPEVRAAEAPEMLGGAEAPETLREADVTEVVRGTDAPETLREAGPIGGGLGRPVLLSSSVSIKIVGREDAALVLREVGFAVAPEGLRMSGRGRGRLLERGAGSSST